MTKLIWIVTAFVFLTLFTVHASEPAIVKTLELKEGEPGGPAKIEDVAWLAGAWTGDGLGGVSEEFWTSPAGGTMTGFYRLVRDNKPAFYEIFIITEVENTLVLKLKHFHPDLTGWEEKDKTVDFRLVKVGKNEAFFDGLTFRKLDDGSLQIFLKLTRKGGEVVEEEFRMTRQ